MNKVLEIILSKFPDHRSKIIELYHEEDDFRTLCEDYLISLEALEQGRMATLKDKLYESEFLQLFHDLEKEIIHKLQKPG